MGWAKLKNNPRKVAIIRLGGLADAARLGFVAEAIRERYPEAEVTLVTCQSLKDWASCMHFDHNLLVNTKGLHSKSRLSRALRQIALWFTFVMERFDMTLCLHDSLPLGWVLRLSGCKNILGIRGINQNAIAPRKLGFDELLKREPKEGLLDFYLRVLKSIDVAPSTLKFGVKVLDSTQDLTSKRLRIFDLRSKRFLAVAPGEGDGYPKQFKNKNWPYFREFIIEFLKQSSWSVLLLGEDSDTNLVLPLTDIDHDRIHSWVGQADYDQYLAALNEAGAFVGCDSGISHIAGCVGIPSVGVFGPTDSRLVQPPGLGKSFVALNGQVPCSPCATLDGNYNWACADNVCMKTISPQSVLKELRRMVPEAFDLKGPAENKAHHKNF